MLLQTEFKFFVGGGEILAFNYEEKRLALFSYWRLTFLSIKLKTADSFDDEGLLYALSELFKWDVIEINDSHFMN